jgi:hypothetical protein
MFRSAWRLAPIVVGGALAIAALVPITERLQARATLDVVASGLVNPRGLNFGPDGNLYVAEAGSGGGDTTDPNFVAGDGMTKYYGETGAVTKIVLGGSPSKSRILAGLPSAAPLSGAGATGPHDVEFQGLGNGFVTIGLGAEPARRGTDPDLAKLGRLIRFKPNGKWSFEEDLAHFEELDNPVALPDSNPYGILALPSRQVYADAGGNTLNAVAANGSISNLAVFPNRSIPNGPTFQAVPTCVALGPDGSLYVGQLTGGPFPAGQANVYRVPSGGGTPEVFASGFTKIIDIAFGPDGALYVLQINSNGFPPPAVPGVEAGALIRVSADGVTKTTLIGPGQGLTNPGGIAIARDGSIYVTNRSIEPGGVGSVVKVTP